MRETFWIKLEMEPESYEQQYELVQKIENSADKISSISPYKTCPELEIIRLASSLSDHFVNVYNDLRERIDKQVIETYLSLVHDPRYKDVNFLKLLSENIEKEASIIERRRI